VRYAIALHTLRYTRQPMNTQLSTPNTNQSIPVEIIASRNFIDWLESQQISLAFTTYQSSRLMFLGVNPQRGMSGFERIFDRAMGLYATPERIYRTIWDIYAAGKSPEMIRIAN